MLLLFRLYQTGLSLGGICGDAAVWKYEQNVLTFTGSGELYESNLAHAWSKYSSVVTSAVINGDIANIPSEMFDGFSELQSVSIPNSVTEIGYSAFYQCVKLESISLPNGLTSIGESAFEGCLLLSGSIDIPPMIQSIHTFAFKGLSNLNSVTLGNVEIIEWDAFSGCSKLTRISIPSSVRYIDLGAFSRCAGLTTVELGCGLDYISEDVFVDCNSLSTVIFHGIYEPGSFYYNSFPDVPLKVSVPKLYKADSFAGLKITDKHEETVFEGPCHQGLQYKYNAENRELLVSGNGIILYEDLYGYTWFRPPWKRYSQDLTHIVIDEGVSAIGTWSFKDCTALVSVSISGSVTIVDDEAFISCSKLEEIEYLGMNDPQPDDSLIAFSGSPLVTHVIVPVGYTSDKFCGYDVVVAPTDSESEEITASKGQERRNAIDDAEADDGLNMLTIGLASAGVILLAAIICATVWFTVPKSFCRKTGEDGGLDIAENEGTGGEATQQQA